MKQWSNIYRMNYIDVYFLFFFKLSLTIELSLVIFWTMKYCTAKKALVV